MISEKVPTKIKILIFQTVVRPTLLYGFEPWPMSAKRRKVNGHNIDDDCADCNGCEPAGTSEK